MFFSLQMQSLHIVSFTWPSYCETLLEGFVMNSNQSKPTFSYTHFNRCHRQHYKGKIQKKIQKKQCRIIFQWLFILGLQKRKSHVLENNLANIGWSPDWFLFWQPYINMFYEGIIDNNDKIRRCQLVSLKQSAI